MIRAIRCDKPQFRAVEFQPGFNLVLAVRTTESTDKDSRNGLGKSTLIDIVHFCLGSNISKGDTLKHSILDNWTFTIEIEVKNFVYLISRNTKTPTYAKISGDISAWPIGPDYDKKTNEPIWPIKRLNQALGWLLFGLPIERTEMKYTPSFRSLISYFIRSNLDAFTSPFEHHRKQATWDQQVHNAFLLNLGWEYARRWQLLKDREAELKVIAVLQDSSSEFVGSLLGTPGELEALRTRLEEQSEREEEQLRTFQILPEYERIHQEADALTLAIHEMVNERAINQDVLALYEKDKDLEQTVSRTQVVDLYQRVGIELPGLVRQRLEDVEEFNRKVARNRKDFLQSEIERIQEVNKRLSQDIQRLGTQRTRLMDVLAAHGALEELQEMQNLHSRTVSELNAVNIRLQTLREVTTQRSRLKIEIEQLAIEARADLEERRPVRQRAVSLFNANSTNLYEAPGSLSIDIIDMTGYKFQVDIERGGSDGIERMKVLCYDFMLAQLRTDLNGEPTTLIHDSTIFADVDERQRARALLMAVQMANAGRFQYILFMNSDQIPRDELEKLNNTFDPDEYVRLTLTDATEDGGLLGMRF